MTREESTSLLMHSTLEKERNKPVGAQSVSEIKKEKRICGGLFVTPKQPRYTLKEDDV
jgi:hypothetical protein